MPEGLEGFEDGLKLGAAFFAVAADELGGDGGDSRCEVRGSLCGVRKQAADEGELGREFVGPGVLRGGGGVRGFVDWEVESGG